MSFRQECHTMENKKNTTTRNEIIALAALALSLIVTFSLTYSWHSKYEENVTSTQLDSSTYQAKQSHSKSITNSFSSSLIYMFAFILFVFTTFTFLFFRNRQSLEQIYREKLLVYHQLADNLVELKESEDKLVEAQKVAKIGSWEFNLSNELFHWTAQMYDIFNISNSNGEPSFQEHYLMIHESDRDLWKTTTENCQKEGTPYIIEYRIQNSENQITWVEAYGKGIKNQDGKVIRIHGTCQDITEKKIFETEFISQQKSLLHQEKLAEIGELASGVGHEINNPLSIIIGYVQVILKETAKPDYSKEKLIKLLNKILKAGFRISKITTGLRNFSRIDNYEKCKFSLLKVLDEIFSLVEEIYTKEGVNIHYNKDKASEIHIDGNDGQIQQVLMNIISNAKDATKDQEKREINIALKLTNNTVNIFIADNGEGVPDDVKSKIFNPFFTTKGAHSGTGIGLSISQKIAVEHGGEISLKYSSENGSCFVVSLPIMPKEKILSINSHLNSSLS